MKRFMWLPAVLAMGACSADEPGRMPRTDDAVRVTVSPAVRAPAVESYPATVVSQRTAEIATRASGTVTRVLVDIGARVRAGDPLVELDANDVNARVSAAAAGEELARRSHRRIESLARDGAASQHELDQAVAGLEAARARRVEAEAQQAYTVVRAPFAGVLTHRSVDPGDLAVPGRPLATLVAPGDLEVVADLPAQRVGSLEPGARVWIHVEGSEDPYRATVSRVVPALGPGSRTFRVEALPDEGSGLVPGAYARLELERPGVGPRWLPRDAVVERGQLTGVFSVESDTLRLRWVRLGQVREEAVELLAGPQGELAVVRRPNAELSDGRAVASVRTEAWSAPGQEGAQGDEEVRR